MGGWFGGYRVGLSALAAGLGLAAACVPAATATSGKQAFHGYIGAVGTQTDREVVGSVVVATGVYEGVGTVVERREHAVALHDQAGPGELHVHG